MDGKFILENFEALAEAPGGVAQLRQTILDLAVRGRLVPQDPDDEPAGVLLERVAEESACLTAEGKLKKQKELSAPAAEEVPFTVPVSWSWTRAGSLGAISPRNDVAPDRDVGFVPMPLVPLVFSDSIQFVKRKWSDVAKGYTHLADGDVAVAKITPCFENGKACVVQGLPNGVGAATTELHVLRPHTAGLERRYLLAFFLSPAFTVNGKKKMTGTAGQKRLPRDYFASTPLPLPPLCEQRRIVAKVDELMALCDEFEERQTRRRTVRAAYVDSALDALATAEGPDAQAETWGRVKNTWQDLLRTPADVEKLRQTILDLAVRGRLVPQDPDDESASVLLGRLREARRALLESEISENKESATVLRKLAKLGNSVPPHALPSGWECTQLLDASERVVDCHNKTAPYEKEGIPIVRTSNIRAGKLVLEWAKRVSEDTYAHWSRRCPPREEDILFTREAPMGEAAVIPPGTRVCLGQRTMLVRPMSQFVDVRYLLLVLLEPGVKARAQETSVGATVPHLRVGDVERLAVMVPPFAEQLRIVAKVDELMALCDELESALSREESTAELLAQAMTASEPPTAARVAQPPAPTPRPTKPARTHQAPDAASGGDAEPEEDDQADVSAAPSEDFLALSVEERLLAVWEALFLEGPQPREEAVRQTAANLREDGLASFRRLRKGGPLYEAIDEAVGSGLQQGWFDSPKRSTVRAVEPDATEWTTDDWRTALASTLDGVPTEREEAMRAAAEWAREQAGLKFQRLRKGGVILSALKTALNSAIRRGEIERVDARSIRVVRSRFD